jgi:hypothetical protein
MSLLKIEKDGGLVGLRDQRGQNESVICGLGGIAAPRAEHHRPPNLDTVLQTCALQGCMVAGVLACGMRELV